MIPPAPDGGQDVASRIRSEVEAMTSSLAQLSAEANSISFNCMIQKGASEQARESMDRMAGTIGRVAVLAQETQETQERSQRVSDLTAEGEERAAAAVADMDRLAAVSPALPPPDADETPGVTARDLQVI